MALALIAYAPAIRGGFIWDDDDYVTNNPALRSVEGLKSIWLDPHASPQYYPLVFTSFWVEQQMWGLNPAGYHVVNVLLHAASAVLLWRLLLMLEVPGAFLAACLFAVHPLHVESVAWITERKNVLCGALYLAAALAYLRNTRRSLAIAFVLFIAAMLSKTIACSLPAALVLIVWWKRGTVTRRDWMVLAPMFVLGALLAWHTAHLEVDWVRARGPEWNYSPVDRALIAGRAVWFYVTKLLLPLGLSFVYPKWAIDSNVVWEWAFPLGVIVALFALWRMRGRWGRGPLVAALIFVGTLVPALGFFNIYPMRYSFVADHYAYLATPALIALAAAGMARWPIVARSVIVAILLVLTMVRASIVADSEKLWRDALAKNPDSWMVNLNLAKTLAERDQPAEAWKLFARVVQLAPELPEAHWNYGISLAEQGRFDDAIAEQSKAIALGGDPLPQAYRSRGLALMKLDRLDEAAADFQSAIHLKPDFAAAYKSLAAVYLKQGKTDDAREMMKRAVQIDPSLLTPLPSPQ